MNSFFIRKTALMIAFIFLFNILSAPAAFSGGIESISENLGQGSVSSDTSASSAGVEEGIQKIGSSCQSIISKIGDFFKEVTSKVKQIGEKLSGDDSFFGKFFKKLLAFFGIGDKNSNCPNTASNETVSNNTAAAANENAAANNSSTETAGMGQMANGEKVTILGQSAGRYQIKRANGKTEWICKKKIRVKSAPKTDTAAKPETASKTETKPSTAKPSGDTPKGTGKVISNVQATGYFPPPPGGYKSKAEAAMEGGALDCRGNKLRTLQNYKPGSYVSCATDPRVIKTGTYFTIDQYPGVKFLACDVGGGIKGNHIDICCDNAKETYKVTGKITVRYL